MNDVPAFPATASTNAAPPPGGHYSQGIHYGRLVEIDAIAASRN